MRPPRADIAIPPFPPGTEWIGDPPADVDRIAARAPVLVHLFDFAQLNCVRALPYLAEWRRRYAERGLVVLGVHSARYLFTDDPGLIADALPSLGIDWPVARDRDRSIWRDYGGEGWPSLFLWGRGGALRWYHLGEGDYAATEEEIRESLADGDNGADVLSMPPVMDPVRPTDALGAEVVVPTEEYVPGRVPISVEYAAGGVYATIEGAGTLSARLDGAELEPIEIGLSGVHPVAEHPTHESHALELEPGDRMRIHSLQFAPGVRPSGRSG
jgi:hypothetical protein